MLRENHIKNVLILILSLAGLPYLNKVLSNIGPDSMGNFLFIVSILLVTVCFANFAFSYEGSNMKITSDRILAHTTTFVFLLLTAMLLEATTIAVKIVYPHLFGFIAGICIFLYLGMVLYDYWDLRKVK